MSDDEDEREKQDKDLTDDDKREINRMRWQIEQQGGLGKVAAKASGQREPLPAPDFDLIAKYCYPRPEESVGEYEPSPAAKLSQPCSSGPFRLIRSIGGLLKEAKLSHVHKGLADTVTLKALAAVYEEGRGQFMTYLKNSGVRNLTDRQTLTQATSKAKNLHTLRPYLDEAAALSAGLPNAVNCDGSSAATAAAGATIKPAEANEALAEATALKQVGNDAFKAAQLEHAADAYADAVIACEAAMVGPNAVVASKPECVALAASLHSNTAMCFIKLERYEEAVASATCAIKLEPANAKALFRRGVARRAMGVPHYELAYQSLLACCKADPNNREAREALESIKAEKTAVKPGFISKAIEKEERWEGGVYDR
jgi:hypothetical protein